MAEIPQGQWFADCGPVGGWHLRWELGTAGVYVPVNQFGRVRSMTVRYCRLEFGELQRILEGESRHHGARFGSGRSRRRRELCERLAKYLNAIGFHPAVLAGAS